MALVFQEAITRGRGVLSDGDTQTPTAVAVARSAQLLASAVLASVGRVLAVLHPPRAPESFAAPLRATKNRRRESSLSAYYYFGNYLVAGVVILLELI